MEWARFNTFGGLHQLNAAYGGLFDVFEILHCLVKFVEVRELEVLVCAVCAHGCELGAPCDCDFLDAHGGCGSYDFSKVFLFAHVEEDEVGFRPGHESPDSQNISLVISSAHDSSHRSTRRRAGQMGNLCTSSSEPKKARSAARIGAIAKIIATKSKVRNKKINLFNFILEELTPLLRWYMGVAAIAMTEKYQAVPVGTDEAIRNGTHPYELTFYIEGQGDDLQIEAENVVDLLEIQLHQKESDILHISEIKKHQFTSRSPRYEESCRKKARSSSQTSDESQEVNEEDTDVIRSLRSRSLRSLFQSNVALAEKIIDQILGLFRTPKSYPIPGHPELTSRVKDPILAIQLKLKLKLLFGSHVQTRLVSREKGRLFGLLKPPPISVEFSQFETTVDIQVVMNSRSIGLKILGISNFLWDIDLKVGAINLPDWLEDDVLGRSLGSTLRMLPEMVLPRQI